MKHRHSIAVVFALLLELPALGEVVPGHWEKVDGLISATEITLFLEAGDRIEGRFQSSSDHAMVVVGSDGIERTFPKTAIRRVETSTKAPDRLADGAGIGAAAGAAAAMISFYTWLRSVTASGPLLYEESAGLFITSGLLGAGIGALAGTAVDAAVRRHAILYRAP